MTVEGGGRFTLMIFYRIVEDTMINIVQLSDFKFSMNDKYEFINKLSASFFKEHGGEKNLKLTLDNKFRSLRTKVEELEIRMLKLEAA